jgi:hypothetical protein
MAVELTKVALWIETAEPGKPLGFLDANITLWRLAARRLRPQFAEAQQASLTSPMRRSPAMTGWRQDISAGATGTRCAGQGNLDFVRGGGQLPAQALAGDLRAFRAMPEDSPDEIAAKRQRFENVQADPRRFGPMTTEIRGVSYGRWE